MKLFAMISAFLAVVVVAHEAASGLDNINLAAHAGPQLLPRGGAEGQEVEAAEEITKRGLRDGVKNLFNKGRQKVKNHYSEKDKKYWAGKQKIFEEVLAEDGE